LNIKPSELIAPTNNTVNAIVCNKLYLVNFFTGLNVLLSGFITDILTKNKFVTVIVKNRKVSHEVFPVTDRRF